MNAEMGASCFVLKEELVSSSDKANFQMTFDAR